MSRIPISTKNAPAAVGPYTQAIRSSNLVFVSGQLALNPETGLMSGKDIAEQTDQVLRNLDAVIVAAGATLTDVIKTTVYLTDINDFSTMNGVYKKYFSDPAPARAAVEVSRLPKDALIEIDAILVIPS